MKNSLWSFLFGVLFGITLCSMVMIAVVFSNQGKINTRVILRPKIITPQNKQNKKGIKIWESQKHYYLKSV